MDKKGLKRWLVRQFLPSRSYIRPAREVTETITVAVFGFGLVFVGGEGVEGPVVGRVFDGSHVFVVGVPVCEGTK